MSDRSLFPVGIVRNDSCHRDDVTILIMKALDNYPAESGGFKRTDGQGEHWHNLAEELCHSA